MGVMDSSVPREKKAVPTISMTAPTRKSTSVSSGMGSMVMLSSSTMAVMGRTEVRASLSFSLRIRFITHFLCFRNDGSYQSHSIKKQRGTQGEKGELHIRKERRNGQQPPAQRAGGCIGFDNRLSGR